MTFIKGTPGCPCCCNLLYASSTSGGTGGAIDLQKYNTGQLYYERLPDTSPFSLNRDYVLDHYHNVIFDLAGGGTAIRSYSPKLKAAGSEIEYTTVYTLGSSERGFRIATVTDTEKIIFATHEVIATATFSFHEVGFDGTGAAFLFTRTASSASTTGQLPHMEVCRANGKLYYAMQKSGDARVMLYRCDLDGSNDTLIFDPGTGLVLVGGYPFAIDNQGERLFILHSRSGNRSSIITCDLDGGSQTHLIDTHAPIAPATSNFGRSVRYSHKTQRVYWWQSNNSAVLPGESGDPTGGMWSCAPDGSDPQQLYGRYAIGRYSTSANLLNCWDIGCGFEQLGTGSLA